MATLMDELKKPSAFGLTAGLLALIVLAALFSGVASVILVVLAYFVGNAAGASAAPDLFRRQDQVITRTKAASDDENAEHGP